MAASVASMIDLFNRDNIRILQELGYEVHVAANFEKGSITSKERVALFQKELYEKNIKVFQVPIPRTPLAMHDSRKAYKILKQCIEDNQYELVHCHSPIGGALVRLAARRARKNGTKVLYSAHGFHFFKGAPIANWLLYYPVEKYLAHQTDVLITICKEDYNRAKRKLKAKKIEYTPGIGVDTEKIAGCAIHKEQKRREIGLTEQSIIVLSVGELNKNKNQEVIIRAIAQLHNPKVCYVLCGHGVQQENLENLAKELKIEKQVHFLGYRKDVYELVQIADIFAFPSYREGLPVSLMEAMSAGLPVVCSKIRGNVDLIEEKQGGFMRAPQDVNGFQEALEQLIQNEELRIRMGNYNRQSVKEFDLKKVSARMKKIYLEEQA